MTGWTGAVLCGGASRRMGTDKALIVVDGEPLAQRVAAALRDAGAAEVFAVGGDTAALGAIGLDVRHDRFPGAGPLGGLITAIGEASGDPVVVLGCDLIGVDRHAIAMTVDALVAAPDADAVVPAAGDRRAWVHGAWRQRALRPLAAAFDAGERAIHRAAHALVVAELTGIDPGALADADLPADLPADSPAERAEPAG